MKEVRENKPFKLLYFYYFIIIFLSFSDDKFLVLNMIIIYGTFVSSFTLCYIVDYSTIGKVFSTTEPNVSRPMVVFIDSSVHYN